ncbi:unnamed protein product [Orchesella dallaii]|uniref:Histone-lysine N-methyltransferase eggless n=1 Tax=Orchesella dallaii TaxID=48710 RepID=A0ABP1Q6G6_9HEXA
MNIMSSLEEDERFPAICHEKENCDPLSDTGPPDESQKQSQDYDLAIEEVRTRFDEEAATEKQIEDAVTFQDIGNHDLPDLRPPTITHPDESSKDIDESPKQSIEFQDHNLDIQEVTAKFDEETSDADWKHAVTFSATNEDSATRTRSTDDVDSDKCGGETSMNNQYQPFCKEQQITLSPEINNLLKTQEISPLAVPFHYGFERIIREFVDADGTTSSECCYQVKSDIEIELSSLEAVSNYLLEASLDIPISMFSFEADVRTSLIHDSDHRERNAIMADISEGQERIRIPVICPKNSPPLPLAIYVNEYITDVDLNVPLQHDDEFLACCDCLNDCKDKLNCACFLRTLDNCSEKTRENNGDLNIGYQYKRLAKPLMSGIFECNKRCKCKSTCFNRVAQDGIFCRLQIFKTLQKGWGVRTLHDIPKGTHICNYVGKVVSESYADKASKDFNNGKWRYMTLLNVGEVDKEGYEAGVIQPEPELPPVLIPFDEINVQEDSKINHEEIECPKLELSIPELKNIIPQHQNGRDDNSIESNYVLQSCDSRVIEKDENEEIMQQHLDSHSTTTLPQMSPLKTDSPSSSSRLLRSGESEDHSFVGNLSPLKEKRFGDNFISLEDHKTIVLLNKISERRSHCRLGTGRCKGKVTSFRFVKECNVSNLVSRNRDLNQNRIGRMKKSSRIIRGVVEEIASVMKVDNFTCSSPRRPFTIKSNFKTYHHKNKRGIVNMIPRRKFVNRYRKELPVWQKPYFSFKPSSRALKKTTKHSFKTVSYGKRKRILSRMNKKRNAAQTTQHSLLCFGLNVDGIDTGNVGRYFNHSCDPNLFPQYVFIDCHDLRLPQIAFFALRNIQAGEELTWNYNYEQYEHEDEQDITAGRNGRNYAKKKPTRLRCYCGKDNCSKRLC